MCEMPFLGPQLQPRPALNDFRISALVSGSRHRAFIRRLPSSLNFRLQPGDDQSLRAAWPILARPSSVSRSKPPSPPARMLKPCSRVL
jgi:hypothetical protein